MALLTRYLSLCDQDDTQILTFVATKSVTRDLNRDITSKEFKYVFITIHVSTGLQMTSLEVPIPLDLDGDTICHTNF